jgi:hypothetical protein
MAMGEGEGAHSPEDFWRALKESKLRLMQNEVGYRLGRFKMEGVSLVVDCIPRGAKIVSLQPKEDTCVHQVSFVGCSDTIFAPRGMQSTTRLTPSILNRPSR